MACGIRDTGLGMYEVVHIPHLGVWAVTVWEVLVYIVQATTLQPYLDKVSIAYAMHTLIIDHCVYIFVGYVKLLAGSDLILKITRAQTKRGKKSDLRMRST